MNKILKEKFSYINIIGYILTLSSIFYLVRTFLKLDFAVLPLNHQRIIFYCPMFLIVYLLSLGALSYSWELILEFVSQKPIRTKDIWPVFVQSNIAKYLPGNVLQYAARNFLGNRLGWKHSDIALSSILEIILNVVILGIALIIIVFLGGIALPVGSLFDANLRKWVLFLIIMVIMAVICLGLLCVWKKKETGEKLKLFCSKKFPILFVKLLLIYIIIFGGLGVMLALIYFFIFNYPLQWHDVIFIMGVFIFSFLAGYIIPGSPGGLGIREYFLLSLLSSSYGQTLTLMASLVHRVISIIGDLLAFFLGPRSPNQYEQ